MLPSTQPSQITPDSTRPPSPANPESFSLVALGSPASTHSPNETYTPDVEDSGILDGVGDYFGKLNGGEVACLCGAPPNPSPDHRIMEGIVSSEPIPWQVAILIEGQLVCGGTLIASKFVLSAAHCFRDQQLDGLEILAGHISISDKIQESYSVTDIFVHPDNNPETFDNDFAVLELSQEIPLTDRVYPACLPDVETRDVGVTAQISGWGSTNVSVPQFPDSLIQAEVETISVSQCANPDLPRELLTENMICAAGSSGEDACQGDSGGPLVYLDSTNHFTLIGVTSWGIGCGDPQFPGIYARTVKARDWIKRTIRGSQCQRP